MYKRQGGDYEVYYFDESGFLKTGKVSNVELDNGETANFYFETNNSHKGRGVTGEENGYLYYKGMRLEAEDDYEFYALPTCLLYTSYGRRPPAHGSGGAGRGSCQCRFCAPLALHH